MILTRTCCRVEAKLFNTFTSLRNISIALRYCIVNTWSHFNMRLRMWSYVKLWWIQIDHITYSCKTSMYDDFFYIIGFTGVIVENVERAYCCCFFRRSVRHTPPLYDEQNNERKQKYEGRSENNRTFCSLFTKTIWYFLKNYFDSLSKYSPSTSIHFCHLCGNFCFPSASHEVDLLMRADFSITKTRLFKYIENFTSKNWKFSD